MTNARAALSRCEHVEGKKPTEAEQLAKLSLVGEITDEVSGG